MCLVCGGGVKLVEKELFGNISGYPSGLYPFKIGVCEKCGLVQKEVSQAYKNKMEAVYAENYTFFTQGQSVVEGSERDRGLRVIESLEESLGFNNKIDLLDYGCGGGHFLSLIASVREWNLYGADVSAINQKGLVESAKLKEFFILDKEISRRFDVVSLNMVLEHLFAPLQTLERIHTLLREEGRLVIRVPNFKNLMTDVFIYEHTVHYTKESLERLLNQSGFVVEKEIVGIPDIEIAVVAKKAQVKSRAITSAGGGALFSYAGNRRCA